MSISDDVIEQTNQCFKNIEKVLIEANSSLSNIVRIFDFEPCWPILQKYLGEVKPAATMFEAGLLDEKMKVEIEVTARITQK